MSSLRATRTRRGDGLLAALTFLAAIWACTVEADAQSGASKSSAGKQVTTSSRTPTLRDRTERAGTAIRERTRTIVRQGGSETKPPNSTVGPKVTPAERLGEGLWDLGGSLLYLSVEGNRRKLLYEEPRKGMAERGVRKSTVYFDGELDGRSLRGTAHAFFPNCAPIGYPVTGEVSPDGRQLTLRGKAPAEVNAECQIIDQRDREITLVNRGPRESRCKQTASHVVCQ
jgi:hypothetical protein